MAAVCASMPRKEYGEDWARLKKIKAKAVPQGDRLERA